jgi:DNA-binding GntR family transcriptional regulator
MPIRADDPRPPYVQLAADLRDAIAAGQYKEGDRLPSTRRLAETHGISTGTVQHAMKLLREEGLIGGHQGRGVFVLATDAPAAAEPGTPKTLDDALDLLADMQRRLDRLEAQAPSVDHTPASDTHQDPSAEPEI